MVINNITHNDHVDIIIIMNNSPKSTKPCPPPPKAPSPTNVNSFPSKGWLTTTHPKKCVVPGRIGKILGFDDYYLESERVFCTRAFSTAAVSTTVNDGEYPPGSTELDDETGHNCNMSVVQYRNFSRMVLGIHDDSWAGHGTEGAFCNAIRQDLDVMLYYYDTDWQVNGKPVSLPGDLMDMATILARITLLLIGADACTPHIINQVWGADETARLALGGPQGDLSLICRRILTHQKVAINTVHIWLTNPSTPVLPEKSESFKLLPRTLQQLLLDCSHKRVFAREPVTSGMSTAQRLLDNMRGYTIPDTQSFEEKAIRWYSDLLLGQRVWCKPMWVKNVLNVTF